jgi:probable rRNA maturation factor
MKPLPSKVSAVADGGPSRKRAPSPGVTLEVEIVRHGDAWAPGEVTDAMLERAARAALDAAPAVQPGSYHVTLVLTADDEMRTLNRTWRGKDAPTNVLSFPADQLGEPGFLGDVVLAHETMREEAREQNLALQDHAAHLVVHGVLHLLGFDHGDDAEAERMEDVECTALASLGVADPYAEAQGARSAELSP